MAICENIQTNNAAIIDYVPGSEYQGEAGWLYDDGNAIPDDHFFTGLSQGQAVLPAKSTGVFGCITFGMSNTDIESARFISDFALRLDLNPAMRWANCARAGFSCSQTDDADFWLWGPDGQSFWDERLGLAGLLEADVQVAWVLTADHESSEERVGLSFPDRAKQTKEELHATILLLKAKFRNLKQVFVSSRNYGGYEDLPEPKSPEPYAYENGYAVKWLIADQVNGVGGHIVSGRYPWTVWGPYLWADGLTPSGDGLTWECADFIEDGVHPSDAGAAKVSERLQAFFDSHAADLCPWWPAP